MKEMKGYKVFNPDWTCKNLKYEVGKTYEIEGDLQMCENGFHFCKRAVDCFGYNSFNPKKKVAEVEALGEVIEVYDKCCTSKIKIVKEIEWQDVLNLVNTGKCCTGMRNSGNWNGGSSNSGDWNSGDFNSGDFNSGDRNNGSGNSGDFNSGDRNNGDWNSGSSNSGSWNSGSSNSGDWNSGSGNSGDWNSGSSNSGDFNSGNRNSGDWNSGYRNSGDFNSGDWNKASNCAGCFNTINSKIQFFNKETDITIEEWRGSDAYRLMCGIELTKWISSDAMTKEEKKEHPEYKTTGGFLKEYELKVACKDWWSKLTDDEKQTIKNIPNFDPKIFCEITGISVEE